VPSEASPIIAVVGRSGVGKTTLIEGVIPLLKAAGLRVATLKHTHHQLGTDRAGTDSFRHREAGAEISSLSGPGFCSLWLDGEVDPTELALFLGRGRDLVLLEGYKAGPFRKIEVVGDRGPCLEPGQAWLTVSSEERERVAGLLLACCGKS